MRFERRDFSDWYHSRRLPQDLSLALMMLLALAAGLGIGAIIMAGLNAPPAQVGSLEGGAPNTPPGSVIEATPMPVPLPMEEEMTVIEPVEVAEPQITEAMMRAYEKAIWQEVNRRREMNGLQALVWSSAVADVARAHSLDMSQRNYFEHASLEGVRAGQRLTDAGVTYTRWGENLHYVSRPVNAVADVDSWMNSPGHRATILGQYHLTGVGIAIDDKGQVYITQNFVS